MVSLTTSEIQHILFTMEELYNQTNDDMPEADESLEILRRALDQETMKEMFGDAQSEDSSDQDRTEGGDREETSRPEVAGNVATEDDPA